MESDCFNDLYKKDGVVVNFNENESFVHSVKIKPSMGKNTLSLIVEQSTLIDLWNTEEIDDVSKKIQVLDSVFYSAMSRGDIQRIYNVLGNLKRLWESALLKFRQGMMYDD